MTVEPLPAHTMIEVAVRLREAMWGTPLILLLAGTGLYLTILLRGLQLRRFTRALRLAVRVRDEPDADGDISHVDALFLSLAGTLGVGTVAGTAAALAAGGPGSVFWMWVAGLMMMAVQFSEAVLGVRFRETDVRGEKSGGPMHYLSGGLRRGPLGRALAIAFAVMAVLVAFGLGNSLQVHSLTSAVTRMTGLPRLLVGGVAALLAGAMILGGIRPISRVVRLLVPAAGLLYAAVTGWILADRAPLAGAVLADVMQGAFGDFRALAAGFLAGILVSHAGIGTVGIAAAAARTREPVRQALIAMLQAPLATLAVATTTAMVILTSGHPGSGERRDVEAALDVFHSALPGAAGEGMAAVAIATFAFTSLLAWAYFGERCIQHVGGSRSLVGYRVLYVGVIPLAAMLGSDAVWGMATAFLGLMALPNVVGLFLLSGIVVREAKAFFGKSDERQPSKRL